MTIGTPQGRCSICTVPYPKSIAEMRQYVHDIPFNKRIPNQVPPEARGEHMQLPDPTVDPEQEQADREVALLLHNEINGLTPSQEEARRQVLAESSDEDEEDRETVAPEESSDGESEDGLPDLTPPIDADDEEEEYVPEEPPELAEGGEGGIFIKFLISPIITVLLLFMCYNLFMAFINLNQFYTPFISFVSTYDYSCVIIFYGIY